ncbi:putative quinol monooxygenase [Myroides guanonis]|uniref:Quinol monooxygenase YgiN n=1 Tax=Myroides guanonis TaxID=1150112 RepID=A0A1I3QL40_9FLAO|nr:putative quinol monooxygenase [Myroides guanonis]SFJ33896.1 Quinol monooxygenase YgiN [Myroides guanonis]
MNIYLTAIIKVKTEYRDDLKTILENMMQKARKEKACIQYDLHQGTVDLNTFVFYEIWNNKKGLEIHNQQTYITEFNQFIQEKTQGEPTILITQKL